MENKASICIRSLKEMEKTLLPSEQTVAHSTSCQRKYQQVCFFPSTSYTQERGFWNSANEELSQRAVVICLQNVNWDSPLHYRIFKE